ncbi:hypothetical protein [Streptomyces sp. bgisy084]|uniref:hypothetical protein n=1 Tax=Streptomyces sp. bgisy084 TaxID=3413777 RepID=UPI003D759D1A
MEWLWFVYGVGGIGIGIGIGIGTTLPVMGPLDPADLTQRIERSQPSGHPDAQVGNLTVSGRGTWFDAQGEERHEQDLVVLSVDPDEHQLTADVAVFHDIWDHFDFRGFPHLEIYKRNAPRIAAALGELDALLGTTAVAVAGDATYFGRAEGHGIEMPDVIDGRGPDLTDRL